ncbi:sigma-70 family RNA polymerase sigma factor [Corynebacterium sp.]|uniref:sigma-70 family RNA polymerase sigma factor n=1 Tax=Corynebacterium sp. TaxID=1720 RepID=UPI002A90B7B0|nr:sigma-70 family RNA polymerase sigma factor [Corynebacterium sp.]MDY5785688.1 sigma-70 family RNA polymerase sigma factor [Corynebacterium sp.]
MATRTATQRPGEYDRTDTREDDADRALVAAYMSGDPRAFATIVQRHKTRLTFIARRYSRNENDVEDILQEALFKASRSMHTYRSESTLSTWLHRLVMNTGFDHAKAARKRSRDVSIDDTERISADANPALAHDPTTHLDRSIVMRQAIEALPEAQRRALLLIDVAGMSVEHAAAEMGVQPGTIKSRRARARVALAQVMSSRDAAGEEA